MSEPLFAESITIRAEPGLRARLAEVARSEKTTLSEFLRREMRSIITSRRGASREVRHAERT